MYTFGTFRIRLFCNEQVIMNSLRLREIKNNPPRTVIREICNGSIGQLDQLIRSEF